jgi:TolB protein
MFVTNDRRVASLRLAAAAVAVSLAGILVGLGGATAVGARLSARPRTLVASGQRILGFALGARRITWVGKDGAACGMHVRALGGGRTSVTPLRPRVCSSGLRRKALGSGEAAWIAGFVCTNSECDWDVKAITAGARHPRTVQSPSVNCAECHTANPDPGLAGGDGLIVYATLDDLLDGSGVVRRIVGGRDVPFFTTGHVIERLSVEGGVIEAVSEVVSLGDGCGCLTAPAWSPDGSKIAYNDVIDYNGPDWGLSARVAVMNADGSGRHNLTPEEGGGPLSWSPDGNRIAYADDGPIGVVNIDGSDSPEICSGGCYDPAWSPDGSKIAFENGRDNAIYVMAPDGSDVQKLAALPGNNLGGFAWSPDGSRIAYSLNNKLHVMNADGSNRRSLGTNTSWLGDNPSWSPDSSQIVFTNNKGLAVIGSDGSGLHQLTRGPDSEPSWSPDGKTIVFGSYRDDPYLKAHKDGPQPYSELYLVDPDGSNLRPLSFTQPSSLKNQATFHTPTGQPLPELPGMPALAGDIAAVASRVGSTRQITLYAAPTGEQLAVVPVGKAAGRLSIVGGDNHWVVFHQGHTISALNTHTHTIVRLTTTPANPLDLSVSGRHVAWAENTHGHGRIRELELAN